MDIDGQWNLSQIYRPLSDLSEGELEHAGNVRSEIIIFNLNTNYGRNKFRIGKEHSCRFINWNQYATNGS